MPDLIITPPVVTAGTPTPTLSLVLTRDGVDVLAEIVGDQIANPAPGIYLASWTACNGVGAPAVRTANLTLSAVVFDQPATISPAAGQVGDSFTLGMGIPSGTGPITVTGVLTQAGVDVTAQMVGDQFTARAAGRLVWTVTAGNRLAPDAVSTASVEVEAIAPTADMDPGISPATGQVGDLFTITRVRAYAGTAPITVIGVLTQAGVDVTAQMVGDAFTPTAEGALVWTETASNGQPPDAVLTARAEVAAVTPVVRQQTFDMSEGSGGTLSAAGQVATMVDAAWAADPTRIVLDGASSRLTSPAPEAAADRSDFVVGVLVRLNRLDGDRALVTRCGSSGATQRVFQFRVSNGELQYVASNDLGQSYVLTTDGGAILAGEWTLLVLHETLATGRLRKDGSLLASGGSLDVVPNRGADILGVPHQWGSRFNPGQAVHVDFLDGEMAAGTICYQATGDDVARIESELMAIAVAKGITLGPVAVTPPPVPSLTPLQINMSDDGFVAEPE